MEQKPETVQVLDAPKPKPKIKAGPGRPRRAWVQAQALEQVAAAAIKRAETARQRQAHKSATTIASVVQRPSLRFLDRAQRLAWLCDVIAEGLPAVKVQAVSLGDGCSGYELVELVDQGAKLKAMDMLMSAMGDRPAGTQVGVSVSRGEGDAQEQVTLVVMDNGRQVK